MFDDFPEDPGGQHPCIFAEADKDKAIQEFLGLFEEEEVVLLYRKRLACVPGRKRGRVRYVVFTLEVLEEVQPRLGVFGVEFL